MISDQQYLNWQNKFRENNFFRYWWVFWALYSLLVVFALGLYFLFIGQYKVVLLALAAFIFARLIISPIIYFFYKKAKPYQRLNFDTYYSRLFSLKTNKPNAFPSDHAISFAAIGTAIFYLSPVWATLILACASFNGIARIILGYHDALDILAGWVLGVLSIIPSLYLLTRFW